MLYRKIEKKIREHLMTSDKIMIIEGARQIGKSFIIRETCRDMFPNYIELNFIEDAEGPRLFEKVRTVEDFYLQVSMIAGDRMGTREDTVIFLDEIQYYPHLITLLKFLRQDRRFTFIASGSLLGLALTNTTSIPIGSIERVRMFPLDFEEFLIANNVGEQAINALRAGFNNHESPDESVHARVMDLFRKYLLVGGLPDAVNAYIETKNITRVRAVHRDIHELYIADAVKYEKEARKKLKITRIYDMIPSFMENKKKRVVVKDIEEKEGARYTKYIDEFEYLISSGIALEVRAISTPIFPLTESAGKNLLKLYLNDVGLLTSALYRNNIRAVLDDENSVNLGALYESAAAQELAAHGQKLFYYDNKTKGEVDFLIDDFSSLSTVPIEVKSGKDYTIHSAVDRFVSNEDYHIDHGIVLSNSGEVRRDGKLIYMPVYYVMFMAADHSGDVFF